MTPEEKAQVSMSWNSPGGLYIQSVLADSIDDAKLRLFNIMARKPETLTGKSALSIAARAKALEDFRDTILDVIRPSTDRQGK